MAPPTLGRLSKPLASRVPGLGPRGEGWVALQLVALAAIVGCSAAGAGGTLPGGWIPVTAGGLLCAAGAALVALGFVHLGTSLTPLPRPHARAELRDGGIYRRVRHPIYGGVVLAALGWSLAVAPLALVPTAFLAVVFELKSRREEAWLAERYPGYAAYRAATPRRFLPWVL